MTRLWGEIITAIGMIAAAVGVIVIASDFPAGGDTMPLFCAFSVILLSIFMIAELIWRKKGELKEKIKFELNYSNIKPFILLAISIAYINLIFALGYFSATFVFLIVATLVVGVRNFRAIAITAVILFPAMYAFFEWFLQARLPAGVLF